MPTITYTLVNTYHPYIPITASSPHHYGSIITLSSSIYHYLHNISIPPLAKHHQHKMYNCKSRSYINIFHRFTYTHSNNKTKHITTQNNHQRKTQQLTVSYNSIFFSLTNTSIPQAPTHHQYNAIPFIRTFWDHR